MPSPFDMPPGKALFRNTNGLFGLVHQFNVHPAVYAHESWFETLMPADLFHTLRKTKRGAARLSRILLRHHRLDNHACYDFSNRWWRFALLPADVIKTLILYCGLAFQHRQIAALVGKSDLENVKNRIGEQAYLFAVQRASLIIGRQRGINLRWDRRSNLVHFARQYGAIYFLSHFRETPPAIAGRLAFKFPRSVAANTANRTTGETSWHFLKRILLHEIDPRWQPFFS